jgi:hypothetical protein
MDALLRHSGMLDESIPDASRPLVT